MGASGGFRAEERPDLVSLGIFRDPSGCHAAQGQEQEGRSRGSSGHPVRGEAGVGRGQAWEEAGRAQTLVQFCRQTTDKQQNKTKKLKDKLVFLIGSFMW